LGCFREGSRKRTESGRTALALFLVRLLREGLLVRNPAQGPRGSGTAHCPPAGATGGLILEEAEDLLSRFPVSVVLPRPVRTWTLTTLREKLIEIGAKVVRHAKAVTFQLAEVAVPRALFTAILGRIGRLRAAPGPG